MGDPMTDKERRILGPGGPFARPLTGAERIAVERALLDEGATSQGLSLWTDRVLARILPPSGRPTVRDLEVAGALIAAEIDARLVARVGDGFRALAQTIPPDDGEAG